MTVMVTQARAEPHRMVPAPGIGSMAEEASLDELIGALRNPSVVFGDAATPGMRATCEMADWAASAAALKRILAVHGTPPADMLAALRLAGEFARKHGLRLYGSPWFCTFDVDGMWARYDIHTTLEWQEAISWDDRFMDVLVAQRMDRGSFHLQFSGRGPL